MASGQHPGHDAAAYINHPSGCLAFNAKNQFFTSAGLPGFVPYRRQGRRLIAFGGLHAPSHSARAALADAFLAFAAGQRLGVVIVQVRQRDLSLLRRRGFTTSQLGTNFASFLPSHSLKGPAKMKLRNKISRARRAGLEVYELGRELPRDATAFRCLAQVSEAWLAAKRKKELDFMTGEIGGPAEVWRRIFVVRNSKGTTEAFITYVPAWGAYPGLLHDLTRRLPGACPGALELCNQFAMERFRREGIAYLHFGFTPFIVDDGCPAGDSRLLHWLIRLLYCRGAAIYPAKTQAQYKLKWGIDRLEREYVAARPLTPRAILDLLMLTRSI